MDFKFYAEIWSFLQIISLNVKFVSKKGKTQNKTKMAWLIRGCSQITLRTFLTFLTTHPPLGYAKTHFLCESTYL